jgi:hypothetical protein
MLAGESLRFQRLRCTPPQASKLVKALNTGFSSMTPEIKKGHARHTSHNHYGALVETNDDDDTVCARFNRTLWRIVLTISCSTMRGLEMTNSHSSLETEEKVPVTRRHQINISCFELAVFTGNMIWFHFSNWQHRKLSPAPNLG